MSLWRGVRDHSRHAGTLSRFLEDIGEQAYSAVVSFVTEPRIEAETGSRSMSAIETLAARG